MLSDQNRIVILSGARDRFIAWAGLSGAESKDLGGVYLTHTVPAFSTTEARTFPR
jgi:hypothetical protein